MKNKDMMEMNKKWRDWRLEEYIEEDTLNEANYEVGELEKAENGHNWKYKMNLKTGGTENESKHLSITKKQFDAIKKILSK